MATYAAGATVERRYPGPDADTARAAAGPQIAAFLNAAFMIVSERWVDDAAAAGGAPIGDAIASGPLTYLAGHGGALVITYQATIPTDLPAAVPAYTLRDPRAETLHTWSQVQIVIFAVFVVVFVIVFLSILGQMMSTSSRMPGFGP
jgi:hypothetical protein